MVLTKVVDGIHIELTPEEEVDVRAKWAEEDLRVLHDNIENGHKYKRAPNYPHIHDQLDMLWHAMDSGEIPSAMEFYNAIAKVKKDNPKPTSLSTTQSNPETTVATKGLKRFFGMK
jgi:hypothetical protein